MWWPCLLGRMGSGVALACATVLASARVQGPGRAYALAAAQATRGVASLPALPILALDSYPAAAREAISRAHRDATARSTDAGVVGALGRLLHAWEQWDAAHQTYARAQALAPHTFDWEYLDAIVLQRLAGPTEAAAHLRQAL